MGSASLWARAGPAVLSEEIWVTQWKFLQLVPESPLPGRTVSLLLTGLSASWFLKRNALFFHLQPPCDVSHRLTQ